MKKSRAEATVRGRAIPPRVAVTGTYNVRDLGNYTNREGRPLKSGVYLRADNLGNLTADGEREFHALGVRTVIDLRTPQEIRVRPNRLAENREYSYAAVDLVGDSHEIISRGDTIVSADLEQRGADGYFADPAGRLVTIYTTMLDHQAAAFRRVFQLLARGRTVFHCVAGQDRTGLVAALLLSLVEVDDETIVHDYGVTARYNVHRYLNENGRAIWGMAISTAEDYGSQFCPPDAMRRTLRHLNDRYGGGPEYLRAIGLSDGSRRAIREHLIF